MTLDYLSATEGLVTENQYNRLHIDLGTRITPLEFSDLAAQMQAGLLPPKANQWIRRLLRYSPALATAPQPYVAHSVSPRLTWYRSAASAPEATIRPESQDTRSKPVLIMFCGNVDRLMLPLPVVLQALPAQEWDILRVTRIPGSYYLRPGTEVEDFEGLLEMIGTELDCIGEPDLTCIGSSSGGGPAIFSALRLNVQRCISLCGYIPEEWTPYIDQLSGPRFQPGGLLPSRGPNFLFVHGDNYEADGKNALQLQSIYGGSIVSVPSVDKHNVLHATLLQGRFHSEFNSLMHGASNSWGQGLESNAGL